MRPSRMSASGLPAPAAAEEEEHDARDGEKAQPTAAAAAAAAAAAYGLEHQRPPRQAEHRTYRCWLYP
jgi:hypothetical protein